MRKQKQVNVLITRKEKQKGEYFPDYDEETGLYCVFHTDYKTGHSFSSYATLAQAGRDAEERNIRKEVE